LVTGNPFFNTAQKLGTKKTKAGETEKGVRNNAIAEK
jgi:hypothetical protein